MRAWLGRGPVRAWLGWCSRVRLALPWTRDAEMHRLISLVAGHHEVTMAQAFALIYSKADDRERKLLAPYRPEET